MPLPIPISQIRKRLVQESLVTDERFNTLADEADRGVLVTAEWRLARPSKKAEISEAGAK